MGGGEKPRRRRQPAVKVSSAVVPSEVSLAAACFCPQRQIKVFLGHRTCKSDVMTFEDKLFQGKNELR